MRRAALQALAAHSAVDSVSTSTSSSSAPALELCRQAWAGSSSWVLTRSVSASTATSYEQPGGSAGGQRNSGGNKQQRRPPAGDRQDGAGPRWRGNEGDQGRQRPQQHGQQRRGPGGGRDAGPGNQQQPRGGRGRDGPAAGAAPGAAFQANRPDSFPSSSGGGPQVALQRQAQPQPERWDLVAANAPRRVFELIGDPRSGVADDTTTSPFGEVTVDMIHHQGSNEVYWYKYEFAGGQLRGTHRDARLSDYSRNLIYLLRAKDPKRWTIQALADKFRIRKQRVLAILALKEMEAQRIESGRLLGGPMSGYALTVSTDDVHLDPASGIPLDLGDLPAPPVDAAGPLAAAAALHPGTVLPPVLATTHKLQSQLLEALRAHRFDPERMRASLLAELAAAEEQAAQVLGGGGDGGDAAAGGPGLEYIKAELDAYRGAVEAVVAAVGQVIAASPLLQEEREAAALQDAVQAALAAAGAAAPGGALAKEIGALPLTPADGGAGGASASEKLSGLQQQLSAALAPILQAGDETTLQRLFFALAPATRGSLVRLLPDLAIRLNAAGVDLTRAAKDADYRGPAAAAAEAASDDADAAAGRGGDGRRLEVDVFGFEQVSEQAVEAVAAAVGSLGAAQAALVAKVEALDPALAAGQQVQPPMQALSAEHLRRVRALVRNYLATEVMWGDLKRGGPDATAVKEPAALRRTLEIMAEADPDAIHRALQVEVAMIYRRKRDFATADAIAASMGEEALKREAAAGAGAAAGADAAAEGAEDGAAAAAPTPMRPGDRARWDAMAAYLDVKVAGKVYSTGSGERHVARLPTYPAFEGYSLEEFDTAREGELSALNRKLAERQEEEMYERFRSDLLYNLGVRGEKLRDHGPGRPPWPANLRTELTRPVVVYNITSDGATQYPPLYVATGDGKTRPLNDQEKVFQERRLPRPALPYLIGRARRKPELD